MAAEDNSRDDIPADKEAYEAWEKRNPITTAIMDDLVADGFVPGPKVAAIIDQIVENVIADKDSLEKENTALRKEVNVLRAKLGMGRKYVEYYGESTYADGAVKGVPHNPEIYEVG